MKKKWIVVFGIILIGMVLFISFKKENGNNNQEDREKLSKSTLQLNKVGDFENFKSILKNMEKNNNKYMRAVVDDAVGGKSADSGIVNQSESTVEKTKGSNDYSSTNIQVTGVDEGDLIKTDGEYIYHAGKECINIIKAYPSDEAEVINRIMYDKSADKNNAFHPMELYTYKNYLVFISCGYVENWNEYTRVMVYDIKDKSNVKMIKDYKIQGNYLSSRRIDNNLYIVSNKYIDIYRVLNENKDEPLKYFDSASNKEESIGYDRINCFPECSEPDYLIVSSFKIDKPDELVDISTYLGSGDCIYMSSENLYIAADHYESNANSKDSKDEVVKPSIFIPAYYGNKTLIYKFNLRDGKAALTCSSKVDGRVLNQFSMDEDKGYFRIATTTEDMKNNIYILDENLDIKGKIEDIAPNEKIYSVRYMGDRAYMVTFRAVDPLFVIDLKNPEAPKILGKLKIPGYSDYLHPYDENHIIGFGKDAVEVERKNSNGVSHGVNAYYLGLKVAMFDVSDVNNPVEMFKINIGDRGTYSELLENHKALLFSKEKNLLAFPVTLMETDKNVKKNENGVPPYGKFAYQGAYIYSINLKEGFKLKGRITHMSDSDYLKAGDYEDAYSNDKHVERIIYIKDKIYTISNKMLKINDMNSLKEIKSIDLSGI